MEAELSCKIPKLYSNDDPRKKTFSNIKTERMIRAHFFPSPVTKIKKPTATEYKQDGRKIETVQVIIQRLDQQAQVKQ
ncbi:hypothetical protein ACQ86K_31435 [Mucilaginibacter sp. P19]|uniref:hypothetical protein n=1 Tax=Mucilaginibacter sp. P19 TaxID=3423947 RepID=UPI003D6656D2